MAEMNAKVRALQRQIAESSDIHEQLKLQDQLRKVTDEAVARVSDKNRPMVEVSVKIIGRFMDEAQAYLLKANAFFNGPEAGFEHLNTPEAIDARLVQLSQLRAANDALTQRIKDLETDIVATLDRSKVSASDKRGFLEGFRQSTGRKTGALLAIRTLDGKLYDQWTALYTLMREQWGHWKTTDGHLVFDKPEASDKRDAIGAEINRLSELQTKAQQVLLKRA